MALWYLCRKCVQNGRNVTWKLCLAYVHKNSNASEKILEEVKKVSASDLPIEMENPFAKEKPQCILCKYKIDANYKNVRLLSQFVSRYTGRIYGRHITGLCEHQHNKVYAAIKQSQEVGLMGTYNKNPNFLDDPDLYDVSRPFKVF